MQDNKEAESKGQESNREEKECLEECPKNLDISKNPMKKNTLFLISPHLHKHGEKLVKLLKAWVFGGNEERLHAGEKKEESSNVTKSLQADDPEEVENLYLKFDKFIHLPGWNNGKEE